MSIRPSVLILCTGNSCRSQMAEGFLRTYAGDKFDVFSAGMEPKESVHPLAVRVMAEKGIDISHQRPKAAGPYLGRLGVGYLIIVCEQAEANCPRFFPGALHRLFWPFDDPATGTIEQFRAVRNQIDDRIKLWLAENP